MRTKKDSEPDHIWPSTFLQGHWLNTQCETENPERILSSSDMIHSVFKESTGHTIRG